VEKLNRAQIGDKIAVKTEAPAFSSGPHIESGLSQGFLSFHLGPDNDFFTTATAQRGICDSTLFLAIHPGELLDGLLTHFYPNKGYRRGHAELYGEIENIDTSEDITFALLLVTLPIDYDSNKAEFENLKDAIRRKNNGRSPDIVAVIDESTISKDHGSDIIFTRKRINDEFEYTIEVTNSPYRKVFMHKDARSVAQNKPQVMVV